MKRTDPSAARLSRRSPAGRLAALLWALVFLLGTAGEGFGLHPCPHHGAAGGGDSPVVDVGHGAHASHARSGAGDDAPADPHAGPCTCGSACQAAAGAALPVRADAAVFEPVVGGRVATTASAAVPVASRPPHFLPFAQAPPRAG